MNLILTSCRPLTGRKRRPNCIQMLHLLSQSLIGQSLRSIIGCGQTMGVETVFIGGMGGAGSPAVTLTQVRVRTCWQTEVA